MSNAALEAAIEAAWEARDSISPSTKGEVRDAVEATLSALDSGSLRVAEKRGADWYVNQWAKKAVLLGFRLKDMEQQPGGPQAGGWWDNETRVCGQPIYIPDITGRQEGETRQEASMRQAAERAAEERRSRGAY